MPELILYCFPGACSRATMIALEETGAPYTARIVNLRKNHQSNPDFLVVNPKGKVPALIVDGLPLTENIAILEYLANAFPAAALLPSPSDAFARAQMLSSIAWFASAVLPAGGRIMRPQRVCDLDGSAERVASLAADEIQANLRIADRHMAGRVWWGEAWSVADAYLFYIVGLARARGVDPSPFTDLMQHQDRMTARPSTGRMLAWESQMRAGLEAA